MLEYKVKKKIEILMEEYSHQEWFGYLTGVKRETTIYVEDISIPPHKEVSGTSCEIEPFHIPEGCVGVIHSHHTMGAFHSGTDNEHVDRNYPVSITVARKNGKGMEFDTVTHGVTPCGKNTTGKASLVFVEPDPQFDTRKFLKEAKENIDKGKREVKVYGPTYLQEGFFNSYDEYLSRINHYGSGGKSGFFHR